MFYLKLFKMNRITSNLSFSHFFQYSQPMSPKCSVKTTDHSEKLRGPIKMKISKRDRLLLLILKAFQEHKVFVFIFCLSMSLICSNLHGELFLHSTSDIASVRRLTHLQMAQLIEDLSGRWDVRFLNQDEYDKIVRALDVENAISLYEMPFWITQVFNQALDFNQVLEDYERIHDDEENHSIILHPRESVYQSSNDRYLSVFGYWTLEQEDRLNQDMSYPNIPIVSNLDPSFIFRENGVIREPHLSLADSLAQLLERENIPRGETIVFYLRSYNVRRNQLGIGVVTNHRHITWNLTRRLSIKMMADDSLRSYPSPVFQKIREQIPLAFHEAAHELVRRVLLSHITDPIYVTVFPHLTFSERENVWHISNGSTRIDITSHPSLRDRRYASAYMAQYLAGIVMDEVFLPNRAEDTGHWDRNKALAFAYNSLICGSATYTCPPDNPLNDSPFIEYFMQELDPSDQQAVNDTVRQWEDYAIFLARHTIVNHLDVLKHLAISVLTRNIVDRPALRDFYVLHPVETRPSVQINSGLTFEQIRSDDFHLLLKDILKPIISDVVNVIIKRNAQGLDLVPSPQVPLTEHATYLSQRHGIRPQRIGDLLLQTWTENMELFNECPFCTYMEFLELINRRHREYRWIYGQTGYALPERPLFLSPSGSRFFP